jgi:hypothetical protein
MVIPLARTIIPSAFVHVTSVLNEMSLVAIHGHGIGVPREIVFGHGGMTWAWAGAAVEQTNIATPNAIGPVHLSPFLAIVLVCKVISCMVLLRPKLLRPSP